MSLSIALITADAPARIAAILEPLRAHADEVVIAADSRVDASTLSGYGQLADRLFRIDFRAPERHLPWLLEQCRGDWILRLDGDEVPSAAFIRRLPEMLAARRLHQFWARVAWLYPDGEHELAYPPWSEDFGSRLVRNDGTLRARGLQHLHLEPVVPRAYVAEPVYHLDLLVSSKAARLDKALRYEVSRPRLIAPGGGRMNEAYYLPELRESLELRSVAEEDRDLIRRVLEAAHEPSAASPLATTALYVPLQEMDRMWEGRTVGADAYRATIEPLEPAGAMAPSEHRQVFLYVTNEGSERWPATLEESPEIRLAHRWIEQSEGTEVQIGPRAAFRRPVAPGQRVLVPVDVVAPSLAGDYVLEVDLVHELVRWFGCERRVPVQVTRPVDLPPEETRVRETPPLKLKRWRTVRIPQVIHRVWLGESEMPAEYEAFGESFERHHPEWEMRLWTDADLPQLDITDADRARARTASGLSNLVRYEVLHRFGGLYVDTDVECLRDLTPLLRGVDAFAALESPGVVGTAVLGSVPDHPAFARAARLARRTLGVGPQPRDANGPYLFSLILEQHPTLTIFDSSVFYPYSWSEPQRRHEDFPDAYAVHHWSMSWLGGRDGAHARPQA
jgi:inositol phosphorylceramide mannosyltransferase catalytic subunit